ncbi:caspase-3-like [Onthophagus taurus]|uniref:caspase-3-like n=1 Tax=Onthophagus taurus TaxID=166361 RepID=UPI0039BE33ED
MELATDSRTYQPPNVTVQPPKNTLPLTLKIATSDEKVLIRQYEISGSEFRDNGSNYSDSDEYPREGDDQGLVIIFNQEKFRPGSKNDVQNLQETFSKLGFNVKTPYINKGRKDIQKICKDFEENNEIIQSNSLIVIFMSHGDKNNILYTEDGQITVMELIEAISNPFKNKPKLFIFQACKATVAESLQNEVPQLIFPIYNLPSDVIIYYSTVEGSVSVRDSYSGSWLISELCKNVLMYGRREDIISLLQRTTKCVSMLKGDIKEDCTFIENYKQMPVIVSTLQKKFYLSSNKYRENIHNTNKRIEEVAKSLNDVVQQVITK